MIIEHSHKLDDALPKILLLSCGGTIAMTIDKQLDTARLNESAIDIYDIEPKLAGIANITSKFIVNIDSTDATTQLWTTLADEITKSYDNYDGFVITFGTNTLGYCSSALSFALSDIGKPVIITGSQVPASEMHSDGRLNLINTCLTAISDIAGVYVVFGSRIIRGTRAKKVSESEYDSFRSFLTNEAGTIGVRVYLDSTTKRRTDAPFKAKNGFERNIASLTLFPDINSDIFTALMNAGKKGFIVRAFGGGDIPHALFPALEEAMKRKVPVVITTQAAQGRSSMNLNEIGLEAMEYGVIPSLDMSIEAMTTKMMWLLKQDVSYEHFKMRMHENVAGEILL